MKIALSGLEKLFKIKRTHADHRKNAPKVEPSIAFAPME